jgi:sec-independent protein translocase protein TatA
MPALGPWELIIVLLIVVVIFGAGRLADIGGAIGKSVREFRSATKSGEEAEGAKSSTDSTAPAQTSPPASAAPAPAPASTAASENKCPSCATVNPAGQVFCGQCGTRLTRAA